MRRFVISGVLSTVCAHYRGVFATNDHRTKLPVLRNWQEQP